MKMRMFILVWGISAVFAAAHPSAAKERPVFCEDARQRVASDVSLQEAVEAVFGRVGPARWAGDSQCIDPLEVLHYGAADVLITNVPEGTCHACGGRFSAYALQRRSGTLRLVGTVVDFAAGGSWGCPGKLTPTHFAGDDALILTSVYLGQGRSEEQISLFVFRGGRIVELTGAHPIILSADNGGAVDESQVISVKGNWEITGEHSDKLTIEYWIVKSGAGRIENVVWGLRGGRLQREWGQQPPELAEAFGN